MNNPNFFVKSQRFSNYDNFRQTLTKYQESTGFSLVVRNSVLFSSLIAKKSLPPTFSKVKNNLPAFIYHHIVFNCISGNNKNASKIVPIPLVKA